MKQTWIYYIHPQRDDLELEGNFTFICTETKDHGDFVTVSSERITLV